MIFPLLCCFPTLTSKRPKGRFVALSSYAIVIPGAQFEGDLGEILALGAEISPYIGLREKWESP